MDRLNIARQKQQSGYNCAQAVACAYSDLFCVDEKTAFRVSEGFGGGMGCMETCGAVTAMVMIAGMKVSDGNMTAPKTKRITCNHAKEMISAFREKNGSIICSELKGITTGVPLRSCIGCVEDAVSIIDALLINDSE